MLVLATKQDKDEIMKIYRSSIGVNGCTWSMEYPNEDIFDDDIARNNLLCLKNDGGEIIGVISIDEDEVVDSLPMWNKEMHSAELARVAVREDCRCKGVATAMVSDMLEELVARGYEGVHLLVSKTNPAAIKCYNKFGFKVVGESDVLGENWWCYEKRLV